MQSKSGDNIDGCEVLSGLGRVDLGPEPENWLPETPGIDHNVVIVGAGQSGTTAAFALRRQGIAATVVDAEREGREGVWRNRARMVQLRTPKNRPGPELGMPALSFRSWFVATHGEAAYDEIDRVPRPVWADYLSWFRKTLAIPVRFETRLVRVQPFGTHLRLTLECAGKTLTETTRKLVLANGLKGGGACNVPAVMKECLSESIYAHTNDLIDFLKFQGQDIGILGASASGFDAAATALETGAKTVHLFCRAPELAHGARYRWADFPGADYFHLLADKDRWKISRLYLERGNHPPPQSIARVSRFANFHVHLGAPWQSARQAADKALIQVGNASFAFDFVIAATGFRHDPKLCGELTDISDQIALWQDRYTPPPGEEAPVLGRYPYLGAAFELQEKHPDTAPYLRNIHVLNTAAMPSHLRIVGDIKCLGYTSERLATGIVRDFFLSDREAHLARLAGPVRPEISRADYEHLVRARSVPQK